MRKFGLSLLAGACLLLGATTASADNRVLSEGELDAVTAGFLPAGSASLLFESLVTAAGNTFVVLELAYSREVLGQQNPVPTLATLTDPRTAPLAVPLFNFALAGGFFNN